MKALFFGFAYADYFVIAVQGALAQRRSSFQDNHFPLVAQAARKAAVAPIHNRGFTRSRVVTMNGQRYVLGGMLI